MRVAALHRRRVSRCRVVELEPSAGNYQALAGAEFDAGNPRAAYAAALRALDAARREGSFNGLFLASKQVCDSIRHGALGTTWRWSQAEPFLRNMEEALPHLRRWVAPALMAGIEECSVAPLLEWRRLHSLSDR